MGFQWTVTFINLVVWANQFAEHQQVIFLNTVESAGMFNIEQVAQMKLIQNQPCVLINIFLPRIGMINQILSQTINPQKFQRMF